MGQSTTSSDYPLEIPKIGRCVNLFLLWPVIILHSGNPAQRPTLEKKLKTVLLNTFPLHTFTHTIHAVLTHSAHTACTRSYKYHMHIHIHKTHPHATSACMHRHTTLICKHTHTHTQHPRVHTHTLCGQRLCPVFPAVPFCGEFSMTSLR